MCLAAIWLSAGPRSRRYAASPPFTPPPAQRGQLLAPAGQLRKGRANGVPPPPPPLQPSGSGALVRLHLRLSAAPTVAAAPGCLSRSAWLGPFSGRRVPAWRESGRIPFRVVAAGRPGGGGGARPGPALPALVDGSGPRRHRDLLLCRWHSSGRSAEPRRVAAAGTAALGGRPLRRPTPGQGVGPPAWRDPGCPAHARSARMERRPRWLALRAGERAHQAWVQRSLWGLGRRLGPAGLSRALRPVPDHDGCGVELGAHSTVR